MLINNITNAEVCKIFDNRNRKIEYLEKLSDEANLGIAIPRTLEQIHQCIIATWDYEISKRIIREMFFNCEKYLNGIRCKERIDCLIDCWYDNDLGEIEWPFSAANFDSYVADINRERTLSEEEKDNIVACDAIKFRRIKEINACRNDYIESLIVAYNENVIPTFKHNRGLDFFINGEPFDQKVSRSVGRAFINDYGDDYYEVAIRDPEVVAISLYENQDDRRFDSDPRLYVVYLDNDISSDSIESIIRETRLDQPIEIAFKYSHTRDDERIYRTHCYVLLLYN